MTSGRCLGHAPQAQLQSPPAERPLEFCRNWCERDAQGGGVRGHTPGTHTQTHTHRHRYTQTIRHTHTRSQTHIFPGPSLSPTGTQPWMCGGWRADAPPPGSDAPPTLPVTCSPLTLQQPCLPSGAHGTCWYQPQGTAKTIRSCPQGPAPWWGGDLQLWALAPHSSLIIFQLELGQDSPPECHLRPWLAVSPAL